MRFEIRGGGAFVILVGLVGLSGAVFALGLVAGFEMARQTQPDINQISTAYPLPSAANQPSSESSSIAAIAASPAAAASQASAGTEPDEGDVTIPPKAWKGKPPVSAAPINGARVAAIPHARSTIVPRAAATRAIASREEESSMAPGAPDEASPPPPPVPRHEKGFNIQVEAVMDKSGADAMVARLKSLGYNAEEYETTLGGQAWYRVRVGPYDTEDEAQAAQARLRDQYRSAYSTSH
jgi:cell division septation protein DedD